MPWRRPRLWSRSATCQTRCWKVRVAWPAGRCTARDYSRCSPSPRCPPAPLFAAALNEAEYAFSTLHTEKEVAQAVRNAFVKKVRALGVGTTPPPSLQCHHMARASLIRLGPRCRSHAARSARAHAVQWRVALLRRAELWRLHDARGGPPRLLLPWADGRAAVQDGVTCQPIGVWSRVYTSCVGGRAARVSCEHTRAACERLRRSVDAARRLEIEWASPAPRVRRCACAWSAPRPRGA